MDKLIVFVVMYFIGARYVAPKVTGQAVTKDTKSDTPAPVVNVTTPLTTDILNNPDLYKR